eukprot:gb/GFBE01019117.1/.p1 GENE.gb/GFBE01019117.1/~~gb/GFBE01019117.1/.p1  ORF type:complete len:243 (+),score=54.93 gb/GFBE01019117.1/:1-729(+)
MLNLRAVLLATLASVLFPVGLAVVLPRSKDSCSKLLWQLQNYDESELLDACQAVLPEFGKSCVEAKAELTDGGHSWKQRGVSAACRSLTDPWSTRQSSSQAKLLLVARRSARRAGSDAGSVSAKEALELALVQKGGGTYENAPTEPLPPYPASNRSTDGVDANFDDEDYVKGQTFTATTTTTPKSNGTNTTNSTGHSNATTTASPNNAATTTHSPNVTTTHSPNVTTSAASNPNSSTTRNAR